MATPFNAKLDQFICPFQHPRATAVDVLSTLWNKWKKAYLFPPTLMLDQLLSHIRSFRGTLVLILDPRSTSARQMQLRSWASDSLQVLHPPSQKVGIRTYTAPWSPSAPWTALLFSSTPSKGSSEKK